MTAGSLLTTIVAFVFALAVLVVFHELGHYTLARVFNVKVLRFSFGFGKTLWSRRAGSDRTEWAICLFPLGGYVKMLDEREAPVEPIEFNRTFNRQRLHARALIVLAGPVANLLLAVVFYLVLAMGGIADFRAQIAQPPVASAADNAGLTEGDLVLAANNEPVASWTDLRWLTMRSVLDGQPLQLELLGENGVHRQVSVIIPDVLLHAPDQDALRGLGLQLPRPKLPAIVGPVQPGSAAMLAGILSGDRLLAADGSPINEWSDFAQVARSSPGRELTLSIERDGERLTIMATPAGIDEGGKTVGRLGVGVLIPADYQDARSIVVNHNLWQAVGYGLRQTWDTSLLTLRFMGRMLTGDVSWRNISGPVTIADYAGQSAHLGVSSYVRFLALISISLGVLNLLPIPVLDGGHLLYYLIEAFKGRALSDRAMEIGQQLGMTILALLMMFAFYNDFNRLLSS